MSDVQHAVHHVTCPEHADRIAKLERDLVDAVERARKAEEWRTRMHEALAATVNEACRCRLCERSRAALAGSGPTLRGWYSYDNVNGFEEHDTEDEARAAVEAHLEACREAAYLDHEWPDDTAPAFWGPLFESGSVVEHPDGEHTDFQIEVSDAAQEGDDA